MKKLAGHMGSPDGPAISGHGSADRDLWMNFINTYFKGK
jgi:hypothetical protein